MLIPDPRRTPLPNLISHNGVILYQWEFLRARLDEGEGLPWIAMDILYLLHALRKLCAEEVEASTDRCAHIHGPPRNREYSQITA